MDKGAVIIDMDALKRLPEYIIWDGEDNKPVACLNAPGG